MRKFVSFMALMKELSFIFDVHLPKPEVFCKLFKDNQRLLPSRSPENSHQEQNISLLSIIISEAFHKRRLF